MRCTLFIQCHCETSSRFRYLRLSNSWFPNKCHSRWYFAYHWGHENPNVTYKLKMESKSTGNADKESNSTWTGLAFTHI